MVISRPPSLLVCFLRAADDIVSQYGRVIHILSLERRAIRFDFFYFFAVCDQQTVQVK